MAPIQQVQGKEENMGNNQEGEKMEPKFGGSNKWLWWALGVVLLGTVGFGGFWVGQNLSKLRGNTTEKKDLTPLPEKIETPSASIKEENSSIQQAEKTVTDFENVYLAYSKDPENDTLRHKVLYDYFVVPTSQKDLDYQKTLAGEGEGGPVLLGSASAGDALQSYTITKKPTDENNLVFEVNEITFNGAQGNTRKNSRTNVIEITQANGKYLIKSYYPKDGKKSLFDGFTGVGMLFKDETTTVNLPIKILTGTIGSEDSPKWKYPDSAQVTLSNDIKKEEIAAYGFAQQIYIAPAGWTNQASYGADGSTAVFLFPKNGSTTKGQRYMFDDSGGCAGCTIDNAAHYFPDVLNSTDKTVNQVIINFKPIDGLVRSPISSHLVSYSLPKTSDGLEVNGVAYQNGIIDNKNNGMMVFKRLEVILSPDKHDLATFLLNDFISRNKLK